LTSSWGEGFPNVIGEAMATSVPCVSSNIGDSKKVINNTGWVIESNDCANSYIKAIEDAIQEDEDSFQQRRESCRKEMQDNYKILNVTSKYRELYLCANS
jgi:glycosyltransferase involved in cell wall biosynthesis